MEVLRIGAAAPGDSPLLPVGLNSHMHTYYASSFDNVALQLTLVLPILRESLGQVSRPHFKSQSYGKVTHFGQISSGYQQCGCPFQNLHMPSLYAILAKSDSSDGFLAADLCACVDGSPDLTPWLAD